MEGVGFFAARLPDLPLNTSPVAEGICASHGAPAVLYKMNQKLICRGCALLKQVYPTPKGKLRLGLGSYMLLTRKSVDYWGQHQLPPPIRLHSAAGMMRRTVRDLILTPPEPPWQFVAFARSNSAANLHVTTSNDLIFFSGKFAIPGSDDPAERLNRKRVMDLLAAAKLTRHEWEKVAHAHGSLSHSPAALAYLQEVYQQHPQLSRFRVPALRTPEYHALRILADD